MNKAEKSWVMYDWANSVYATIATFAVAVSAPFLGALGDLKGMKKRMLSILLIMFGKKIFIYTLSNVAHIARDIVKNKAILIFIIAYFFYIDGVNTVIHMSTAKHRHDTGSFGYSDNSRPIFHIIFLPCCKGGHNKYAVNRNNYLCPGVLCWLLHGLFPHRVLKRIVT